MKNNESELDNLLIGVDARLSIFLYIKPIFSAKGFCFLGSGESFDTSLVDLKGMLIAEKHQLLSPSYQAAVFFACTFFCLRQIYFC